MALCERGETLLVKEAKGDGLRQGVRHDAKAAGYVQGESHKNCAEKAEPKSQSNAGGLGHVRVVEDVKSLEISPQKEF